LKSAVQLSITSSIHEVSQLQNVVPPKGATPRHSLPDSG
jgi:hypothetical protein